LPLRLRRRHVPAQPPGMRQAGRRRCHAPHHVLPGRGRADTHRTRPRPVAAANAPDPVGPGHIPRARRASRHRPAHRQRHDRRRSDPDLPAPVGEPQLGRMARRTRRRRVRRRRPGVRRWRPLGIGRHRRRPVRSVGPEGITQEGSGTMTGLRRTPRIGKVLAAGALIGLAGCHQVPPRSGAPSPLGFGNEPKGGGTTITPAQEADVQISMGRVAEQQGDLDQAMAAYRAALDRDKSRADAYARLAILHDKQGKFRESAELYRKALALRPGDPDIFCDMGYSFYLQRRWAEAEMSLRQSLAINPEHRRAHNNLALLLVRDSRLDDALAEFGKAGSDPVQAHMNLAFALTTDQRWESARAEYQRALALDPSSQLAKARLDELNNLLAKREPAAAPAPDGARRDPALLTTATAAPPARPGPDGPTAAATPPQPAPSRARRDPALLTTAAVF